MLSRAAILFVVILASDLLSLSLADYGGSMAALWTTNGIAAGVLLSVPRRSWIFSIPAIVAAMLVAPVVAYGAAHGGRLWLVPANLVEIAVVTAIIHRRFPTVSGQVVGYLMLGRTVIFAALAACLASMVLAEILQSLAPAGTMHGTAEQWLRAHLLGMVIVGMLTLVGMRERGRMFGVPGSRLRMWRDVFLLAAITVALFAQTRYPLLFLVFAPLLYLVFHYRFAGLVLGVAIVTLVTTVATSLEKGPLALIPLASQTERVLIAQAYLGVICLVAVPVALALAERHRLAATVVRSESLYRLLADYASDLVVRVAFDGTRRYVSPSVKDMLGWTPEEFAALGDDRFHPDDLGSVQLTLEQLQNTGRAELVRYRIKNRSGEYRWLEAMGKVAPSPDHPGEMEVVYSARDVTERMLAEAALADSQIRLRTITDNVPAVIAHVDTDQRYTFVNAYAVHVTGLEAPAHIGRTVEEVRGSAVYALLRPHIEKVLGGAATTFEYEVVRDADKRTFQATYLPATTADGAVSGFYTLTTEITQIKQVERQLDFLAHHDALTGIANRLSFRESVTLAVERAASTHEPLLLMMIDIDRFKQINDTYGHAAGDTALSEVAARLRTSIRKSDLLARIGGDEFVVLCHDIGDVETASQMAQKFIDAMLPPVALGESNLHVSLSIGVGLCRQATSPDALAQIADEALYQAKEAGRNGFRIVTDGH